MRVLTEVPPLLVRCPNEAIGDTRLDVIRMLGSRLRRVLWREDEVRMIVLNDEVGPL